MEDLQNLKRKRPLNDVPSAHVVTKQRLDSFSSPDNSMLRHEESRISTSHLSASVPHAYPPIDLWPGSQLTPINRPVKENPQTRVRMNEAQQPGSGSSAYPYDGDLDNELCEELYGQSSSPLPTRSAHRLVSHSTVIEAAERLVDTTQLVREQAEAEKKIEAQAKRAKRRVDAAQRREQKLAQEEKKRQAIATNKATALAAGNTADIAKWTLLEQKELKKQHRQQEKEAEIERRKLEREAERLRKAEEKEAQRAQKEEEKVQGKAKKRTPPKDGLKQQTLNF